MGGHHAEVTTGALNNTAFQRMRALECHRQQTPYHLRQNKKKKSEDARSITNTTIKSRWYLQGKKKNGRQQSRPILTEEPVCIKETGG